MKVFIYSIFAVMLLFCNCGSDPVIGENKFVIKVNIEGQGKVKGTGAFNEGDVCRLTAVPDSVNGYKFDAWLQLPEEVIVSTDKTYSFEVDETRLLKVIFIK
jgi:hypothetical protein